MTALRRILLAPLLVALSSCIFATDDTQVVTPDTSYHPLDSPENVLHNLVVAAGNRDLTRYTELLDPDFQFRFQPGPGASGPCATGVLDRSEDLAAVGALFADPKVKSVAVTWSLGAAEPSTEVGMEGLTRIRTRDSRIETIMPGEGYFVVVSVQEFHFRLDVGKDEISRWHLVEWKEIEVSADPSLKDGPTPTQPIRLWEILCGYSGY